jgi:GT2 family glycosyltransferase
MESNPRVSVIIISQAQRSALEATLSSLVAARLAESAPVEGEAAPPKLFEVLVVDCGSRDGSATLDEQFEGITFMRLPKNFGWTRAFNIATRTAKGEYLFHLPPGLTIEPNTIPALLAALQSDPQAGAVSPAGRFYALPKPGDTKLAEVPASQAQYPHNQAVLYPRLALSSINYFPDKYGQHFADLELFHKMREAGKKLKVLEELHLGGAPAETPLIDPEIAEADRLHGLSVFYGKNYGGATGLKFTLGQALGAAFRFRLGLAGKLFSGTKVDGL